MNGCVDVYYLVAKQSLPVFVMRRRCSHICGQCRRPFDQSKRPTDHLTKYQKLIRLQLRYV